MSPTRGALWGIILAGGEGERLKGFTQEHFGVSRPKQFCAFVGRRSMLERTIRRARLLIPPERLVVSGTAHHSCYIGQAFGVPQSSTVVLQPANRDTAPGILLPLIHILRKDPQALVVILPADHFILPGHRFMRGVAAAAKFVEDTKGEGPILLAVRPDRAESEYGWIDPGEFVEYGNQGTIRRIVQFVEKPPRDQAERMIADGWLWNTMVIVVRAETLMNLIWQSLPHLAAWFSVLQRFTGDGSERHFVEEMYHTIPKIKFSTSVLASRDMRAFVLPIEDVYWSDWGTKERILDTATTFGLLLSVPSQTPHVSVTIFT